MSGSDYGTDIKSLTCNRELIRNYLPDLPIVRWLPKYSLLDLQSDITAGLAVGLMVVPQALAYSSIAGLPNEVKADGRLSVNGSLLEHHTFGMSGVRTQRRERKLHYFLIEMETEKTTAKPLHIFKKNFGKERPPSDLLSSYCHSMTACNRKRKEIVVARTRCVICVARKRCVTSFRVCSWPFAQ